MDWKVAAIGGVDRVRSPRSIRIAAALTAAILCAANAGVVQASPAISAGSGSSQEAFTYQVVAEKTCRKYLPNIGRNIEVPCEPGRDNDATDESEVPVHECDRLAAFPSDKERVTKGIEFESIDGPEAVTACREATQKYPDTRRFKFQLARALDRTAEYDEAVSLYRSLAEGDYAAAKNNLGTMYEAGTGVAKDQTEAFQWFRKGAEAGNTTAMNNVGLMYAKGQGTAKDEIEAVRWFRKGADAGDAGAMNNLGTMYDNGTGIGKDWVEAIRWYQKGAEGGDTLAMSNLAGMYHNGRGVAEDDAQAAAWYRKGAEAGGTDAMGGFASMLANGQGIARDPSAASQWMFKALKGGDEWATEQMTTNSSAWDAEFRTELQQRLKEAGLYSGPIDGQFGAGVLSAIKALGGS